MLIDLLTPATDHLGRFRVVVPNKALDAKGPEDLMRSIFGKRILEGDDLPFATITTPQTHILLRELQRDLVGGNSHLISIAKIMGLDIRDPSCEIREAIKWRSTATPGEVVGSTAAALLMAKESGSVLASISAHKYAIPNLPFLPPLLRVSIQESGLSIRDGLVAGLFSIPVTVGSQVQCFFEVEKIPSN